MTWDNDNTMLISADASGKLYRWDGIELIEEVGRLTKVPVLLNTSFNLKDQTITLDPKQAIERYINSQIDYLVINNFLIIKKK